MRRLHLYQYGGMDLSSRKIPPKGFKVATINKGFRYGYGRNNTGKNKRTAPRNPTEADITCRPFDSRGTIDVSDGIMRNFSSQGCYVETSHKYKSGTIVIVRILCYPSIPSCMAGTEHPRSISLAEVKWQQELVDENAIQYGISLRYLT